MKNYQEFIEGLQEDIQVPEQVWARVEETLHELPEPKRGKHTGWMCAAAAAAVIVGAGFCYTNPALASKLPVIGQIFEKVEDQVTFSGEYSDRGTVLTEEKEEAEEAVKGEYTVTNQGVEVTASEVYCDGHSIFLTVKVADEEGVFTNIPEYSAEGASGETIQSMYLAGNWRLEGAADRKDLIDTEMEGTALDDHTFIGMIKMDLDEKAEEDGILQFALSGLEYDDVNGLAEDGVMPLHQTEGTWEFSIPFSVDKENAKEITVGERSDQGYGIDQVFVSPYQIIIDADVPDPQEGFYDIAVYDQDGKAIKWANTNLGYGTTVYAVKQREISKLQIYLFDDPDVFPAVKLGLEEAKEKAVMHVDVNVKE